MEVVSVPTLQAWPPATATLSPPQSFSLFSWPGPGATPKCRLDFPRAPGAALSCPLCPGLSLLPVLPVLGWGRLWDSHCPTKYPSRKLITTFVENVLCHCHAYVLFFNHLGVGAGEGLFVPEKIWSSWTPRRGESRDGWLGVPPSCTPAGPSLIPGSFILLSLARNLELC